MQGAGAHGSPVKSPRSKRVLPPAGTIESINLDAVPQSVPRLDNTAAKHKLSVKPKNQRISRKHRRFTQVSQTRGAANACRRPDRLTALPRSQDLEGVSVPGAVQEDEEAAGASTGDQRRGSVEERLKKQKVHEEERLEMRRKREVEEQRLRQEEEERRRQLEEVRLRELEEERRRQEEAEKRKREEEERRVREEEERRQQEEEEQKRREEEEDRKKREEEEEARRQQLEALRKKKLEEEAEERKRKEEAEKLRREKEAEAEAMRKEAEQRRTSLDEPEDDLDERKRRAEELRWREMEERQRPFSFKVSSGEKQILFQKVNLTPVTPASGHQSGAVPDQREGARAAFAEGADSPTLPASPYVPHTAILVTGAQLCGTAVNLDQIKDTACKSLLGLGDDRKVQATPHAPTKTSPDRKSGKTKSLNESSASTDQSSAAVLAEWASIRSKIFKGVEEGKYDEYPEPSRSQPPPGGEDQLPFAHANLRKTVSASAKFSITPAKKKFGDANRSSEVLGSDDKEAGEEAACSHSPTGASPGPVRPQSRLSKSVRMVDRGSEECMFAKDLPSFLVPSPGARPEGAEFKVRAQSEGEAAEGHEKVQEQGQDGDEKPSPFGIKLRRTNYSLRFHGEQSTEKRKKRYSAGDSFDGVPSPLTPIEPDSDASPVFSDKVSPVSPQREGAVSKYLHTCASPAAPRAKAGTSGGPPTHCEGEKAPSKSSLYRRPATSPRPTGSAPTPPPSPKAAHGPPGDAPLPDAVGADLPKQEATSRSEEASAGAREHGSIRGQVQGEEEPKEKRSFFPSINIPWREKVDRKTELIRRGQSLKVTAESFCVEQTGGALFYPKDIFHIFIVTFYV